MLDKRYIVTCDWCGYEDFMSASKRDTLDSYARHRYLYKFSGVNAFSDTLYIRSKSYVPKYLMFCCEECADKYFKENPEDIPHYKHKTVRAKPKRRTL